MDLDKLSSQSSIELSEDDKQQLEEQITEVMEAFNSLDDLDLSDEEPAFHPVEPDADLREDEETESLTQEEALSNSENTEKGSFIGPGV
jgi:aspartyl-tRNA(Asn)/glutamyl-tRNA(Gln) amidotransferase subunit C